MIRRLGPAIWLANGTPVELDHIPRLSSRLPTAPLRAFTLRYVIDLGVQSGMAVTTLRPGWASRRGAMRRPPAIVDGLLLGMMVGGSFLAFRWNTPFGNVTIARVFVLAGLIAMGTALLRLHTVPGAASVALGASLAVLLVTVGGLIHTPAAETGLASAANTGEALLTFFLSLLLVHNVVRARSGPGVVSSIARLPMWGYLPTGVLGAYQGFQLLAGGSPTIPFLEYARLHEATLNSARTAFHGGLNEFSVDRIAAAMGDPASYGIFSAAIIGYCLWAWQNKLVAADIVFCLAVLLGVLGVILSASPGAVLVLAVALLCNLPRHVAGWGRSLAGLAVVVGALLLLVTLMPQAERFMSSAQQRATEAATGEGTVGQHVALLGDGWRTFRAHPLFGVGTGGLGYHQHGFDPGFSSVHNTLVLALAEGGVVLGVAVIALWASLWRRLIPGGVLLPVTAAWLLYLDFNRVPALWVVLGVAGGLFSCKERIRRSSRTPDADDLSPARPSATAPVSEPLRVPLGGD